PPGVKDLITTLTTCPESDIPTFTSPLVHVEWPYPKTDFFHWVPVANRFDTILEHIVSKYDLKHAQQKQTFEEGDKAVVLAVLEMSRALMENCTNRNLYNSYEHLADLVHTHNLDVLNATLRLLYRPAQRMHNQRILRTAFGSHQDRLVTLAQHWGPKDSSISFVQLASDQVELSPDWFSLSYQFYRSSTSEKKSTHTETPAKIPKKGGNEKAKEVDGVVTIGIQNVREAGKSAGEVFSGVVEEYDVPEEQRFALFQKVRVAWAVGDKEERRKAVVARVNAIAVLALLVPEDVAQSKIFLYEPDLVQKLADVCQADKGLPYELQIAALHALDGLSNYRSKLSEVLTAVNASANHGILMHILRKTITEVEKDDCPIPAQYVHSLLDFVTHLCSSQSGGSMIIQAGMIPNLVHLVGNRRESQLRVVTKAVSIMDGILFGFPTALTAFIQGNGLDVLVLRIKDEVDYFVDFGKELANRMETDTTEKPEPPHERVSLLRAMLKFVLHMMQGSGAPDRLRNLIDTTLPGSLLAIFENTQILGTTGFGLAVNIMATFIHNEPTSLSILQEARLPQTFLRTVKEGVPVSAEVVSALPGAFGAVCLNEAGLNMFNEVKPLQTYLDILTDEEHFRSLAENEVPSIVGNSVDELIRHHPSLKAEVLEGIIRILKRVHEIGEEIKEGEE
ncbi:hypothetical protein HK097_009550, partial [Rhizophlyctis rosea]